MMSKNLYTLPESWAWRKFGDILHVERGGSPRPIDDYITTESDGINWIKIGDTKNSTKYIYETAEKIKPEGLKKSRLVVEGDFILSNSMSFGKPYIMKTTGCIHDGWLLLRPKNENLDKEFLYYVLGSSYVYEQFKSKASGTTVKNLNSSLVKDVDIPLPPLEEQRRIVGKLDGLFAKIDKSIALLDENIASANALMPSALNEVFEELGEKWKKTTLANIAKFISGYAFKSDNFESSNQLKVIKITNVGVQEFIENDEEKLPSHFINKYSNFMAESNDIAIALTRPYISNGLKVSIVSDFFHGAMVNQRVATLRAFEDKANQRFIYYFLCTNNVLDLVKELSKTLNQPNLSINDLKKFEIPLPPLDIQTQTVAYLDTLHVKAEALKKAQETKKKELLALKASLLESAFKGEL